MRGTFLLFLHGGEQQDSRISELMEWLYEHVGMPPDESGTWVVSPFNEMAPGNWPQPFRMLTQRMDPALVIKGIQATRFEHPVQLLYRTGDEQTWSFLTLNWERPTDEGGFPL